MRSVSTQLLAAAITIVVVQSVSLTQAQGKSSDDPNPKTMNVLFIGNSYTGRHKLSEVVKQMAEAGQPGLKFNVSTVIYGGRTLSDHWRLGTQNFVKSHSLTKAEEEKTIASLEEATKDKSDRYAKGALSRHKQFLADLENQRQRWDLVVLQSYRDDLKGDESLYVQFAPRFAKLAKEQGARVILYVTTPKTQNAKPLGEKPDANAIASVLKKSKSISSLANRIEADAADMALVALKCQTQRPDITLRFINDAHLNQDMAYLTACTIYSAIFKRSPVGLPVDSATDIRYWENKDKTKDRDKKPITRIFSAKDKADLQRIAWEGYQEFEKLRTER